MRPQKSPFWRLADPLLCRLVGPQFVGGDSIDAVLRTGAQYKYLGYDVTYNLLGEHVEDPAVIEKAVETTEELIERMDDTNIGNISVKPTLYGLQRSPNLFHDTLKRILELARKKGVEVEVDAESYKHIHPTFEIFSGFAEKPSFVPHIRQAVQAHLKEIFYLMKRYNIWNKNIRVVKGSGVYPEDPDIVVDTKEEVRRRYLDILLFNMDYGMNPYAATVRDSALTEEVIDAAPEDAEFQFQMLYGLFGRNLGRRLTARGYPVRMYIPFTDNWCRDEWKQYGMRRAEMMRTLVKTEIANALQT